MKDAPAPIGVAALAELQRDVDGWRGSFRYAAEIEDDEGDEHQGALVFEPENEYQVAVLAEHLDPGPGESLARMLNAVGPLLGMSRAAALHGTRGTRATAEVCAAREAEGRWLRAVREHRRMSRRAFADALGVSVDVLRRWEAGTAPLPATRRDQVRAMQPTEAT